MSGEGFKITPDPLDPEHLQRYVESREFQLVVEKVANRYVIPPSVRYQSEWKSVVDYATQNLMLELTSFVLTDKLLDQPIPVDFVFEYETHRTGWQRFKEEYLPTFSRLLRRPPKKVTVRLLKTKYVNVQDRIAFPEAPQYPLELGRPVRFQTYSVSPSPYHPYG